MALQPLVANNLRLKVGSLLLAIFIWFIIRSAMTDNSTIMPAPLGDGAYRTFYRMPITVMTTATDGRVFRIEPQEVDVTVRSGSPSLLRELTPKDIEVFVNLTGVTDTEKLIDLQVWTPPGVRWTRVSPPSVRVARIFAAETPINSPIPK